MKKKNKKIEEIIKKTFFSNLIMKNEKDKKIKNEKSQKIE